MYVVARTDFKLRYHGSFLGYVWTLLKPLMQFLVMLMVFSVFMSLDVPNYRLYLLLGIIFWNFFVEGTTLGMTSLASKVHVIKRIPVSPSLIVFASTLGSLWGFLINMLIYFILAFILGADLLSISLVGLLISVVFLYILIVLFAFLLSSLYVYFRDIVQIWDVLMQLGFWSVPVIFSAAHLNQVYQSILYTNPVTISIEYARFSLGIGEFWADSGTVFLSLAVTTFLGIVAFLLFRHNKSYFAERL